MTFVAARKGCKMSFKSIIQDMKSEFESFSRKGFDVKFGYGSKSKSRQLVEDSSVPVDAFMQSCWANMPPELLRDVLIRIEESESTWPDRQNVVACAGVCRNWRDIVKEIVKTPELSRMLTFPISLKQPGPRDSLIQCFIKRDRICQTYSLYLCEDCEDQDLNEHGKFLLSARKCRRPTCTDYIITSTPMTTPKARAVYIGKLRSNFLSTKFTIFDAQPPNAGAGTEGLLRCHSSRVGMRHVFPRVPVESYPISHISYELNVLGSRGPRRMHCVMDAIPASAIEPGGVAPTQIEFVRNVPSLPFFRSKSISGSLSTEKDGILMLRNKAPRWHEQLQCWCLNFNGRVTVASVKNFQLVACVDSSVVGLEPEKVVLQFGKVGKDLFTMDYQYPISAFQAFAICLSSFDTKIACE